MDRLLTFSVVMQIILNMENNFLGGRRIMKLQCRYTLIIFRVYWTHINDMFTMLLISAQHLSTNNEGQLFRNKCVGCIIHITW